MGKVKGKRYRILFFLVEKRTDDNVLIQNYDKGSNTWLKRKLWIPVILLLTVLVFFSNERTSVSQNASVLENSSNRGRKSNHTQNSKSSEVRHIAFLKVHKTGGTTIQNILFRFGIRRNLTFVIPVKGNHFSYNGVTHEPILDPLHGSHYDILAMHSVLNISVFSKILPRDYFVIGIIREPLDAMISAAFYHRDVWKMPYLERVPKESFIQNLVRYPELYDSAEFSHTKNFIAYDFGFPEHIHVSDTKQIQHYLSYIGRVFHFVMIMEHFSESLVMMRRLFNWDFPSILYIPVNAHAHKNSGETNLTDIDRRKFKERNFLDVAVYEYFYSIFMTKLSLQKSEFFEEVRYFDKIQKRVELYCLLSKGDSTSLPLIVESSEWSERFLVTTEDCDKMKMNELDFVDTLRKRQIQLLYDNL